MTKGHLMLRKLCKCFALGLAICIEPVLHASGIPHPEGIGGVIANALVTTED